MKYIILIFTAFLFNQCKSTAMQPDPEVLKETDRSFAKLCKEKGIAEAFIQYADEMAIKLNNGSAPTFGKKAIQEALESSPTNESTLQWEPLKADIAASGDLGYTFGTWEYTYSKEGIDTTLNGVYVSIWKKQTDGKWKYVLDGGNSTPNPSEWIGTMP